jgi:hypothetical protein
MSGTYPASPIFKAVDFTSVNYNVSSETQSGRVQVRNLGGQRWEFSAEYSVLYRADFQPVMAFVMKQRGMLETFQIVLPQISDQTGDAAGTVLTVGAHAVGDSTIDVDGATGTFKAGDMIKFGHTKVYMITDDVTAAAGEATINIIPPLVVALADDEVVTFDAVPFTVRLSNDVQEYELMSANRVNFDLDFIEAV